MAPDLNALADWATDGYAENGVPRHSNYEIPDIVLGGPYTRKIKVISIGAVCICCTRPLAAADLIPGCDRYHERIPHTEDAEERRPCHV